MASMCNAGQEEESDGVAGVHKKTLLANSVFVTAKGMRVRNWSGLLQQQGTGLQSVTSVLRGAATGALRGHPGSLSREISSSLRPVRQAGLAWWSLRGKCRQRELEGISHVWSVWERAGKVSRERSTPRALKATVENLDFILWAIEKALSGRI